MVEFKRGVYEMALTELSRSPARHEYRNRYLRGGMRQRDPDQGGGHQLLPAVAFEPPPGATFEPDPTTEPSFPPHTSHAST